MRLYQHITMATVLVGGWLMAALCCDSQPQTIVYFTDEAVEQIGLFDSHTLVEVRRKDMGIHMFSTISSYKLQCQCTPPTEPENTDFDQHTANRSSRGKTCGAWRATFDFSHRKYTRKWTVCGRGCRAPSIDPVSSASTNILSTTTREAFSSSPSITAIDAPLSVALSTTAGLDWCSASISATDGNWSNAWIIVINVKLSRVVTGDFDFTLCCVFNAASSVFWSNASTIATDINLCRVSVSDANVKWFIESNTAINKKLFSVPLSASWTNWSSALTSATEVLPSNASTTALDVHGSSILNTVTDSLCRRPAYVTPMTSYFQQDLRSCPLESEFSMLTTSSTTTVLVRAYPNVVYSNETDESEHFSQNEGDEINVVLMIVLGVMALVLITLLSLVLYYMYARMQKAEKAREQRRANIRAKAKEASAKLREEEVQDDLERRFHPDSCDIESRRSDSSGKGSVHFSDSDTVWDPYDIRVYKKRRMADRSDLGMRGSRGASIQGSRRSSLDVANEFRARKHSSDERNRIPMQQGYPVGARNRVLWDRRGDSLEQDQNVEQDQMGGLGVLFGRDDASRSSRSLPGQHVRTLDSFRLQDGPRFGMMYGRSPGSDVKAPPSESSSGSGSSVKDRDDSWPQWRRRRSFDSGSSQSSFSLSGISASEDDEVENISLEGEEDNSNSSNTESGSRGRKLRGHFSPPNDHDDDVPVEGDAIVEVD